ncbi:MAG: YicC/YloC family endoribonuclease [Pseudomonadota bacterium]
MVHSMTGFARSQGHHGKYRWHWEMRSVNGKGLDLRLRLPSGFEALEPDVRKRAGNHLKRGNVQLSLSVEQDRSASGPTVNQAVLESVLQAIDELEENCDLSPSSAADILSLRGVLDVQDQEEDEDERKALIAALIDGLDAALSSLVSHRAEEGEAMAALLVDHLSELERLTLAAEANPSRSVEAIRERLARQVAELLEASDKLDPDRLHAEAAILATKADLREELDRLKAHIVSARNLIAETGPIGRKLDFLSQEFNREANTLCSKSNAAVVTAIGLELKVVIDQFREQVQNIE